MIIDMDSDPVIRHLKKVNKEEPAQHAKSIDDDILDQIALDGLSGTTLPRLLRLLEAVHPNTNCTKNERMKHYVYSVVVRKYLTYPIETGVRAYYLDPKAKQDDNGSQVKSNVLLKDIPLPRSTVKRFGKTDARLYPVQDGLILGSCAKYKLRCDISKDLIENFKADNPAISLKNLQAKFGLENVHFVAGQTTRYEALLPSWFDPNVDIKLREYCILEMIGKSRTLGTVFPNDKTLGRYRIMLVAKRFITQYQEAKSTPIVHHIDRFSHCVRHLSPEIVETAADKEVKESKISRKRKRKEVSSDDEDNCLDGNRDIYFSVRGGSHLSSLCCDPGKLRPDRSTLNMLYDIIAESPDGLTQLDMRKKLNLPKFHIRNHLKNLLTLRMICSFPPKDPDSTFRIYRTTHKSSRRRRRLNEQMIMKKLTGVMASWDKTDLEAKQRIGHKRSSFSQAEDSLLILCRITSILIEPSLKLSWCVHKRLVRDLLHAELIESRDKTSDACLRRIKYLKKLPNNIMSINELTAELRDDMDVIKLVTKSRRTDSSEGNIIGGIVCGSNDEKLNKLFIKMLKLVRSKIPGLLGIPTVSCITDSRTPGGPRTTPAQSVLSARLRATTSTKQLRASSNASLANRSMSPISESLVVGSGAAVAKAASAVVVVTEPLEYNNNPNCSPEDLYSMKRISSHKKLKENYELVDCQFVASINRGPTYEPPKNAVDVRFNNVSLVTMAFTLCSLDRTQGLSRRAAQWLLERFYSGFPDKLISSVLSKLNKRSLLTRKCPDHQASLYKPKTKMSLKLNRNVLFLLNRYQSSSLMQLAQPISQSFELDLNESNEMLSVALLTSYCSLSSFNLALKLTIPANVIGNLSEDLIVQPCNINFTSDHRLSGGSRKALQLFLERSEPKRLSPVAAPAASNDSSNCISMAASPNKTDTTTIERISSPVPSSDSSKPQPWLVKSYELLGHVSQAAPISSSGGASKSNAPEEDTEANSKPDVHANPIEPAEREEFEPRKIPIEFSARLWKRIDGRAHLATLLKLVESLLCWITVHPGVERDLLQREFSHLMPAEHLLEILDLMEDLELISRQIIEQPPLRARLFGYAPATSCTNRSVPVPAANRDAGLLPAGPLTHGSPGTSGERSPTSGINPAGQRDRHHEPAELLVAYEASADAFVNYCQLLAYRDQVAASFASKDVAKSPNELI